MVLNSLRLFMLTFAILGAKGVQANDYTDEDYFKLSRVEVSQITTDVLNQEMSDVIYDQRIDQYSQRIPGLPNSKGIIPKRNVGEVINMAQDLVALGESLYTLVQKGRPNTKTTYAPISVIPKQGDKEVDIFETENWKMPKKFSYQVIYKNMYGMEVVKFRYSVIFSHGGTYQGRGAYLTATQIIPESVSTSWGFDFSATMKLGGIQNQGSRQDPIAAALLLMEYRVETFLQTNIETNSYLVTGRGGFKVL